MVWSTFCRLRKILTNLPKLYCGFNNVIIIPIYFIAYDNHDCINAVNHEERLGDLFSGRQCLGGLASPISLSPEASSSKGGSAESDPIPSGGGSAASLGRSRAAGGKAAEGTRAGALWIRGCLSSQASVASHCVGAQVLQTVQGAILEHARCRGHCWCVSQLDMALQHVLHRILILLLGERDVLRSAIKITRNVENM